MPALSRLNTSLMAIGGVGTSIATMFVGATGPLVGVFLKVVFTDRRALVAAMASTMTLQHSLKVVTFTLVGVEFWTWTALIVAMIASGYLGTITGTHFLNRMDEGLFRKGFRIVLTVIALDLLRRAVMA